MTQITLSYFDFSGGRGEDCRLALHVAGVPFEDDRVNPKNWPDYKPTTPYGAMPVLQIEGEGTLAQSNAILGLLGTRYGLLPENDFEAARHRAALNSVEDMACVINRTSQIADEEQKRKAREEIAQGYMKSWAQNVENQIKGPYFGGNRLSVADLKLFVFTKPFRNGAYDPIPSSYFDEFKKLCDLLDGVSRHPAVVDWYTSH